MDLLPFFSFFIAFTATKGMICVIFLYFLFALNNFASPPTRVCPVRPISVKFLIVLTSFFKAQQWLLNEICTPIFQICIPILRIQLKFPD